MEIVDPLIGKQLGNYRLEQRLGHGSCGVVYRCEHVKLKTPFAIKILHPVLATNEESAARFLREARTAARIQHENVVFIADFDVEPSVGPYFVMEYLDGLNLRDAIDQEAPFEPKRIAMICEQICQALSAAHRAGVIHRDLKPDNISIQKRGPKEIIKILDFGIAKITRDAQPGMESLTQHGRVLGTPRYFSPEQARGADLDHRSDIYSFGIILYEMLVGEPPFSGKSAEEMVLYHLTIPPPRLDPERFPPDMQDLVDWLLAKLPDERPDDMDEVWSLLAEALRQMDETLGGVPGFSPSHTALPAFGSSSSLPSHALLSRPPTVGQTQGYVDAILPSSMRAAEIQQLPTPPRVGTPSRGDGSLVGLLAEVLERELPPERLPAPQDLAHAIQDALHREGHLNPHPEQVEQALRQALQSETTQQHGRPDELIQAIEQVLHDSVDLPPRPSPPPGDYSNDHLPMAHHDSSQDDLTKVESPLDRPPLYRPEEPTRSLTGSREFAESTQIQQPPPRHNGDMEETVAVQVSQSDLDEHTAQRPSAHMSAASELTDPRRSAHLDDSEITSRQPNVMLSPFQNSSPPPEEPSIFYQDYPDVPTALDHRHQRPQQQLSDNIDQDTADIKPNTVHVDFEQTVAHEGGRLNGSTKKIGEHAPTTIGPPPTPSLSANGPSTDPSYTRGDESQTLEGRPSPDAVDDLLDASLVTVSTPGLSLKDKALPLLRHPAFLGGAAFLFVLLLWQIFSPSETKPQPRTPTPPPAPCLPSLQLKTQPARATVWRGKQRLGRTPLQAQFPGECGKILTLTIRRRGYVTLTKSFRLSADEIDQSYNLRRLPFVSVRIVTRPSRARLYYKNNRVCRKTPCTRRHRMGTRRVYWVKKRGYRNKRITVYFRHSGAKVTVKLRRRRRYRRRRRRR